MSRIMHSVLSGAVFAAVVLACGKEPQPEPAAASIEAVPASVQVDAKGGNEVVTVTANQDWTASSGVDWITVSPPQGKASDKGTSVLLRISANPETAERSGKVTFRTSGDKEAVVTVSQKAADSDTPQPPEDETLAAPAASVKASGPDWLVFRWDRSDHVYAGDYEFEFLRSGVILRSGKTSEFSSAARFLDLSYLYDAAVVFGALESNTEYAFRVRVISAEESVVKSSDWTEVKGTTGAPYVETETDAVLVERFNKMVFSGDYFNRAWGFRPTDAEAKTQADLWEPASMIQVPDGTTGDYFNTSSYPKTFRENIMGLVGWEGSKVYGQFGFPKIGTSSAAGYLTTCPLGSLSGKKNLVVRFNAMPYCDLRSEAIPDPGEVVIDVLGGGAADKGVVTLTEGAYNWTACEFHVKDATAATQIKFATTGASRNRFFIDDIVIREYTGSVDINDAAPGNVRPVAAHPTDLSFEWDAAPDNLTRTYTVYLYESASGDPVRTYSVAFDTKFHRNGFIFAALEPGRDYWLGVQSKGSEIVKIQARTTEPVTPGPDVIFYQGFDACRWGGDHVLNLYGAKPATTNASTDPLAPMDAVQTPNGGGSGNMFGTHSDAWRAQRGLADWPKGTACYEFPGYFKFGAASSAGTVALPPLQKLGVQPKDIILSFDASPWVEPSTDPDVNVSDQTTAVLTIQSGPGSLYRNGNPVSELCIDIEALPQRVWTKQSVEIKGATEQTVILFNSRNSADGGASKCRWCIDNILVVPDGNQTDYGIGGGSAGNLEDNQW